MSSEHSEFLENGIHEIRPKVLFGKVEEAFPDRNVMFSVSMPASHIGGLTLLESSILVALAKLTSAQEYFEFGTFFGATTVLLAQNSTERSRITTIDLVPEAVATAGSDGKDEARYLVDDVENDNYLRRAYAGSGALCIDRAEDAVKTKIQRLFQDSRTLDLERQGLLGRFDFVFIDGGHDLETIGIDSRNAMKMAKEDSVIVWHDFRSKIHGDVTRFLDEFARTHPVIHVQNSMIAFMLNGRFGSLL